MQNIRSSAKELPFATIRQRYFIRSDFIQDGIAISELASASRLMDDHLVAMTGPPSITLLY